MIYSFPFGPLELVNKWGISKRRTSGLALTRGNCFFGRLCFMIDRIGNRFLRCSKIDHDGDTKIIKNRLWAPWGSLG